MSPKERFVDLYRRYIHREGADKLLEYLLSPSSDFFEAPASTRYHGARPQEKYGLDYDEETVAIVALLHDLCKVNVYKTSFRNVKDATGRWTSVPYYEFDDQLPYGHGEKSVYIISGYMRLSREEAFAIRYHMGFSNETDSRNVGAAFNAYPLAAALYIADMEATFFVDDKDQ